MLQPSPRDCFSAQAVISIAFKRVFTPQCLSLRLYSTTFLFISIWFVRRLASSLSFSFIRWFMIFFVTFVLNTFVVHHIRRFHRASIVFVILLHSTMFVFHVFIEASRPTWLLSCLSMTWYAYLSSIQFDAFWKYPITNLRLLSPFSVTFVPVLAYFRYSSRCFLVPHASSR